MCFAPDSHLRVHSVFACPNRYRNGYRQKGGTPSRCTVTVKGTKNGTSTNPQGVYTLNNVGADAVLVFTGAGITKQEVAVSGKGTVNTSLEAAVSNLNEVVVVGYGTEPGR